MRFHLERISERTSCFWFGIEAVGRFVHDQHLADRAGSPGPGRRGACSPWRASRSRWSMLAPRGARRLHDLVADARVERAAGHTRGSRATKSQEARAGSCPGRPERPRAGSRSRAWPRPDPSAHVVAGHLDAVPEVGARKPVTIFIVVDLPAPLGPRNPSTSPRSTEKLTPSTARSEGKSFVRFWIWSIMGRSAASAAALEFAPPGGQRRRPQGGAQRRAQAANGGTIDIRTVRRTQGRLPARGAALTRGHPAGRATHAPGNALRRTVAPRWRWRALDAARRDAGQHRTYKEGLPGPSNRSGAAPPWSFPPLSSA